LKKIEECNEKKGEREKVLKKRKAPKVSSNKKGKSIF
jgi:hypothetical protein